MRTREQIMQEWDAVRAKIANGCTNSGPSDWLEGVLDDVALSEREACAKLAKAAARAAQIIDDNLYRQREKVQDASAILRHALR